MSALSMMDLARLGLGWGALGSLVLTMQGTILKPVACYFNGVKAIALSKVMTVWFCLGTLVFWPIVALTVHDVKRRNKRG